ncbi:MAG TPA: secreted hydrolase, partial [Mycobacterium sp.]|nr:secreted hydrolase [Mycobacterium sp.]
PPIPEVQAMVDRLVPLVAAGRRGEAVELLTRAHPGQNDMLATILDDLVAALSDG